MNCRFIIAKSLFNPVGGYSWMDVYRLTPDSQLTVKPNGIWNITEGFKSNSHILPSIYLQRNNLEGVQLTMGLINVSQ